MAEALVDVSIHSIVQLYALFREVLVYFLGGVLDTRQKKAF